MSRMRGNETAGRIVTNFCTGVGVHDVITSANFYDCRLWGLSVVRGGGQILGFSIDSRRRPYNTLALPCECVIWSNAENLKSKYKVYMRTIRQNVQFELCSCGAFYLTVAYSDFSRDIRLHLTLLCHITNLNTVFVVLLALST